MANVAPTTPTTAGVVPTSTSPTVTAGDDFDNPRGDLMLRVTNGSGGSINVTLTAVRTARPADGAFPAATQADLVIAVGNGVTKVIGPIPAAFVDANGRTHVLCSAVSSVTIESYRSAA